jgi:hypothetical protein
MKPDANRLLYTGDCNYLFANHYGRMGQGPYDAQVLHDHVDLLADSGVDTYVLNPNGQVPWYPSRALSHVLTGYRRGDTDFFRGHYPPTDAHFTVERLEEYVRRDAAMLDRYLDLVEAGVDWVAETAAACRRRKLAPWLSIRMNDAHGGNSWERSYMNCPPQRDPNCRLSGKTLNPRHPPNRTMAVCDYRRPEVRDYYFTMIRELVEDYDYEGLELDWLRTPSCCEPPASKEDIGMMLDWMDRIRQLTARRARQTGKAYPLGLRTPCRLGTLRTIGLDVPEMARRGLIDFVGFSNTWQTSWDVPYDRLRRELGDDVAIYGVIEDAPNWMFARDPATGSTGCRLLSTSPELLRANAAGKLATGVDGIELFNFFCSDSAGVHGTAESGAARYDALRGLSDLDRLRGTRKHYALETSYNFWATRFFEFADQLPATVEHGAWRTFELALCAEPAGAGLQLTLQLVLERSEAVPELGVSLNGSWPTFEAKPTDELLVRTGAYSHHIPEHIGLNYRLAVEGIREGWNQVTVFHGEEARMPNQFPIKPGVRIVSLELSVH